MKTQNKQSIIEKPKRLGIVGGLGTETSCKFCTNLDRKIKKISGSQPDISMEILPVTTKMEGRIVGGDFTPKFLDLMSKAVIRLENSEVDFIVIPCNAVHIFLDKLRAKSSKQFLSIIEETAKRCKELNLKKVGLLSTLTTINEKLHENKLKEMGVELIVPEKKDQEKVNIFIKKILAGEEVCFETNEISRIIKRLKNNGAEAVILGCTELSKIQEKDSVLPLINTLEVLEDAILERWR